MVLFYMLYFIFVYIGQHVHQYQNICNTKTRPSNNTSLGQAVVQVLLLSVLAVLIPIILRQSVQSFSAVPWMKSELCSNPVLVKRQQYDQIDTGVATQQHRPLMPKALCLCSFPLISTQCLSFVLACMWRVFPLTVFQSPQHLLCPCLRFQIEPF